MADVLPVTQIETNTKNNEKDQRKKKKRAQAFTPVLVGGIVAFVLFVVFFWKNFTQKKELASNKAAAVASTVNTANTANSVPTDAAQEEAVAQAMALEKQRQEYRAYFANLRTEKESLLQQLNANYEEAKKNKELFLQINQETDEESIEASFQLKDEKDKQRVQTVEHNKMLLEQKNNLVEKLEQIEQLLQQEQGTEKT